MHIRPTRTGDLCRVAEIFVFNNRINYYPIFRCPEYSFGELQVVPLIDDYFSREDILRDLYVAERDSLILGFMEIHGDELHKLYVDPCFQRQGIGDLLIRYAVKENGVRWLWALEKNTRAVAFYNRHGFTANGERTLEEDTTEYLLKLVRSDSRPEKE